MHTVHSTYGYGYWHVGICMDIVQAEIYTQVKGCMPVSCRRTREEVHVQRRGLNTLCGMRLIFNVNI